MSFRSWIRGLRVVALVVLVALVASVSGCATTVVGALRAPVSDCTSHCNYLTGDDARYACLLQCPGARYSPVGCGEAEPESVACANDRREDTAENEETARAVVGLLGLVLEVAADAQSSSCHEHHRRH
jgi:hypothetical protein